MHFFRPTVKPESDELVSADVAEGGTVLDEFTDDPVFLHSSPSPIGYVFSLPGRNSPFRVKYIMRLSQFSQISERTEKRGGSSAAPRKRIFNSIFQHDFFDLLGSGA